MLRAAISARGAGGALTFHGYFLTNKNNWFDLTDLLQGALAIFWWGALMGWALGWGRVQSQCPTSLAAPA